jgi:hypothetical protein
LFELQNKTQTLFHQPIIKMKFSTALLIATAGSAAAFSPFAKKEAAPVPAAALVDTLVGALEPVGFFDPLGFAAKADDNTLRRYREAELTHARVASKFLFSRIDRHGGLKFRVVVGWE